jgi:hypothetical protein
MLVDAVAAMSANSLFERLSPGDFVGVMYENEVAGSPMQGYGERWRGCVARKTTNLVYIVFPDDTKQPNKQHKFTKNQVDHAWFISPNDPRPVRLFQADE